MAAENKSLFALLRDKLLLLGLAVVIVAPVAVFFYVNRDEPGVCHSAEDLEELPADSELVVTNGLTDEDVTALARFDNLLELELHYSEISDAATPAVAMHTGLQRLVVHGVNLTDAGVREFAALKELRELSLMGCVEVSDAGLDFLDGLPHLQVLMLHRFPALTDALCETLAGCEALTHLNLDFCYRIGDAGIAKLSALHNLRELSIHGLDGLTDDALPELAKLKKLEKLELPLHAELSHEAISALHEALPNCEINR